MSKLRVPLKRYLVDEVPEAALHEVWQGIRKRRTRRAPPVPLRFAWVGLVAAFIVSSVLWLTFHEAPGPLATLDGAPPRTLGGPRPERVVLSDGSAIELAEQSSLEVLSNDRESFVTVLRQGRGTFDVKPGGSRRWRIEAGPVEVEVVGTRFTVERSADQVFVHVERGAVLVRGNTVPDRVQRLNAGAGLVVGREPKEPVPPVPAKTTAPDASASSETPPQEPSPEDAPAHDASPTAAPASPSLSAPPPPRAHPSAEPPRAATTAAQGAPEEPGPAETTENTEPTTGASRAGGNGAPSTTTADQQPAAEVALAPLTKPTAAALGGDEITELLRTADRQRAEGNTAAAIITLRALLKGTSHDPRRALAAFTLAKLLVERGHLLEAEAALRTCLSVQPSGTLAENAWARLVEVQLLSGQPNAARRSVREYARRFPNGQRLKELRQLIEDSPP